MSTTQPESNAKAKPALHTKNTRFRIGVMLISLSLLAFSGAGCGTFDSSSAPDSSGSISFEEAAQLVLDEVAQTESIDHEVIVFGWQMPLLLSDELVAFNPPEYAPPSQPLQLTDESWFFWVDDAPGARYAHPSRFVTVDRVSSEINVVEEEWWPLLNGAGIFTDGDAYWDEDNWVFSNLDWRPGNPAASSLSSGQAGLLMQVPDTELFTAAPVLGQDSPGRAIIISGNGNNDAQNKEFATDSKNMLELLDQAGFDAKYYGPESDTNPDRDGVNDFDSVSSWFRANWEKMEPGDTLFVYITGHGYVSKDDGEGNAAVTSEGLLQTWLGSPFLIDPGVNIIIVIDSCYSGSFVDTTDKFADMTITSTSATDPAYFDRDDSNDPNPEDVGGEFSSGFVEGWRRIMSDPAEVDRVRRKAADRGISFFEALSGEAYLTAVDLDAGFINEKTFPLLVPGQPSTKPTPSPTPTITPSPTATLTPTPDYTPTPEYNIGTVNVAHAFSRYGPSQAFLNEYEFEEGQELELIGHYGGWLLTEPEDFPSSTWIWSGLVDTVVDVNSLPFVNYDATLPYTEFAPSATGIHGVRNNDGTVSVCWNSPGIGGDDPRPSVVVVNVTLNGLSREFILGDGDMDNCVTFEADPGTTVDGKIYIGHQRGYSQPSSFTHP